MLRYRDKAGIKTEKNCSRNNSAVFAYLVVLRPAGIAAAVESAPRVELPVDSGHSRRMRINTALSGGVDHSRQKRGACADES